MLLRNFSYDSGTQLVVSM